MKYLKNWFIAMPLLLAVFQSLRFCFDHGIAWQLVEVGAWKPQIIAWGVPLSMHDLCHALNWKLFEYAPRLTRPLSNLFELFDTPFRAMAWRFITPSPAMSLTWPFSLIAAPVLLYLLLRRLGVETRIALLTVALYMGNPGVLSLEVMIFRPGKALSDTAIIFCLWLAARQDAARKETSPARFRTIKFAALCMAAYFSFFLDEGGLILFPALLLLFPRLTFRSIANGLAFLALVPAYIATIKIAMPALSAAAGYRLSPTDYAPAKTMWLLLTFRLPQRAYSIVADNILGNARIILLDSLGLIDPRLAHSYCYIIFLSALCAAALLLAIATARSIRWTEPFVPWRDGTLVWRAGLMLIIAFAYEGLLMSVSLDSLFPLKRIWGLYYYGVFCVLFLLIFFALACQRLQLNRPLLAALVCALVCGTTFIFPWTNQSYKNAHYYPFKPDDLTNVFSNQENRFNSKLSDANYLREKAGELRQTARTHTAVRDIPLELSYALYELNIVQTRNPGEFRQDRLFDLDWVHGQARIHCHD